MEVKETLQILLDHGIEFINTDCEIPFSSFLTYLLRFDQWTVESIRLLIRRGAEPGLYVQPWGGCLPLAIYGSYMECLEGLRDALILLIKNGADVYAKDRFGRSATDIAYNASTEWLHCGHGHPNSDLRLRDIWTEALAACGYDAEEVICRSLQVAEVTDSDGDMDEDEDEYDISEDEDEDNNSDADVDEDEDEYDNSEDDDEDNDSTHQDDGNITQSQGPELSPDSPKNYFICETCRLRRASTDDESQEQIGSEARGHYDWSLLEDDTNVWRE